MAKRNPDIIRQPITLSPEVQVIIVAHRDHMPVIKWDGPVVTVALQGAELPAAAPRTYPFRGLAVVEEPETNGPTEDTPEIAAQRAALLARHPPKKKVFTSADAFEQVTGERIDPQELETGLNQAIANGAVVV